MKSYSINEIFNKDIEKSIGPLNGGLHEMLPVNSKKDCVCQIETLPGVHLFMSKKLRLTICGKRP